MEDFVDYDPADNSAKSYAAGIKAIRLERIRRGISHPRPHVSDEMAAWREGVFARSCINGALAAVLAVVAILAILPSENQPAGKIRAASTGTP